MEEDPPKSLPSALRDDARERHGLVRRLGGSERVGARLLFFYLAFFPTALTAVGAAVAYEHAGTLVAAVGGAGGGLCVGLLVARDFLHWRLRPFTALAAVLLTVLFFATHC